MLGYYYREAVQIRMSFEQDEVETLVGLDEMYKFEEARTEKR